jgi:SAM-dependent methyltransferase
VREQKVAGTSLNGRSGPDLGQIYDDGFFSGLEGAVDESAGVIVPIVCSLLAPDAVLDVGCGRGTWLRVFAEHGVADIYGVDGPYVLDALEIAPSSFGARDLTAPLDLGRRFDLVVSLEVAEHLDPRYAEPFVASLVKHAPAVLFSAAIPFQGGPGHVNEAWQSSWATRFAAHGYEPVDAIRPEVWSDERVAFWYAQNTLLYVDAETRQRLDGVCGATGPLDVVHPRLLERTCATLVPPQPPPSLSRLLKELPAAATRATRRRAGTRSQ